MMCYNPRMTIMMTIFDFDIKPPSLPVDFFKATDPGRRTWPTIQTTTWNRFVDVSFAETLTKRGFGYTFNILDEEKLLDFKR
jgi:hypothetical protein